MKRLFIVHDWKSSSKEPMINWLGEQGKILGYETTLLDMPNSAVPTMDKWVSHLDEAVQYVEQNTYFIGHGVGCQAILRYLQTQKGSMVGGVIMIAPWIVLTNITNKEDQDILRPWQDNPIEFVSIRSMGKNFTAIFSDNDSYVPLKDNEDIFEAKLNAKSIVENNKGHFTEGDGVLDLASAIGELKGM